VSTSASNISEFSSCTLTTTTCKIARGSELGDDGVLLLCLQLHRIFVVALLLQVPVVLQLLWIAHSVSAFVSKDIGIASGWQIEILVGCPFFFERQRTE